MTKTLFVFSVLLAFAQTASAYCTLGMIRVMDGGGAVLATASGEAIGHITNPQGLTVGERGYFHYSVENDSGPDDTFLYLSDVRKVPTCPKTR